MLLVPMSQSQMPRRKLSQRHDVVPMPTSSVVIVRLAWASFFLVGWCGVLVPSLVRQIEGRFGVDDAALGLWYLVNSGTYAAASISGGLLTERFGRRAVLPAAGLLFGAGLAVCAAAPTWLAFLAGAVPMGAGAGAIDGGMNALVLAVARGRPGRALNLLHLFVGIGALSAPIVVGQLVDRAVPWEGVLVITAVVCAAVALTVRRTQLPTGRRVRAPGAAQAAPRIAGLATNRRARIGPTPSRSRPLILLALAIGCYVAGEIGVSNWIVRFLEEAPVTVATLGLSGFWAGLAAGRLVSAGLSDRFPHRMFAAVAAVGAGLATLLAVAAPTTELTILAFAVAGFASGPVFPMIMAIGGELFPDRVAATTGSLTGAAVLGGTLYPPLIGVMSGTFGIAVGLVGAGLLSLVCGVAIVASGRVARGTARDAVTGA
jgi:fucose permease